MVFYSGYAAQQAGKKDEAFECLKAGRCTEIQEANPLCTLY